MTVLQISSLGAGVVIAGPHLGNFGEGTPEELEAPGCAWSSPAECSAHELRGTEGRGWGKLHTPTVYRLDVIVIKTDSVWHMPYLSDTP